MATKNEQLHAAIRREIEAGLEAARKNGIVCGPILNLRIGKL